MPFNVIVSTVESKLEFSLHKNSLGKQLFDQVVKTLGIREVWYFGIQYPDKDGNLYWLKLDKKITSHDLAKEKPTTFYFRVKYYPEDVAEELIEDITREFFYLQIKSCILKSEVYCPPETAVLLSSYVCQMRLGDFDESKPALMPTVDKLLPSSVLEKHNLKAEDWLDRIVHCYKQHKTMSKEDAILEYLKICQDLEMYGVSYFPIKNKKGTELFLGVDSMGLNIYEKEDMLTPKVGFPWGEVKNISYKSKKFILKPSDKNAKEWHFFVDRVRYNRQILALSIGNHELYMRRRKCDSIEVQQMKSKAQELRESKAAERQKLIEERLVRERMERELSELKRVADQNKMEAKLYEEQVRTMREELEREQASRSDLEQMQEQLRLFNQQLSQEAAQTAEEKERLMSERNNLEDVVKQNQARLEEQQRNIEVRTSELQELKLKVITNNNNNNDLVNNHSEDVDVDDEDQDLEVLENYHRNEENRTTEVSRNVILQKQLAKLREDLSNSRDQTKTDQMDRQYEENQRLGVDKFKTLRQIRQGNTKKRVDQFESM